MMLPGLQLATAFFFIVFNPGVSIKWQRPQVHVIQTHGQLATTTTMNEVPGPTPTTSGNAPRRRGGGNGRGGRGRDNWQARNNHNVQEQNVGQEGPHNNSHNQLRGARAGRGHHHPPRGPQGFPHGQGYNRQDGRAQGFHPRRNPDFENNEGNGRRNNQNRNRQEGGRDDRNDNHQQNRNERCMGFKTLEEIAQCDSQDVFVRVNEKKTQFLNLLDSAKGDSYVIIMEVITKVCQSTFDELKLKLLLEIFNSCFVKNISHYLIDLPYVEVKARNSLYWNNQNGFWNNFVAFCKSIIEISPSIALQKCRSLIEDTSRVCLEKLKERHGFDLADEYNAKLQQLRERLTIHEKEEIEKKDTLQRRNLNPFAKDINPPNDFRQLSILPTRDDLLDQQPFLRPNIINGGYQDIEHYLDIQFRLLREDCFGPLREGINQFIKDPNQRKYDNIRVYHNVNFIEPFISKNKIGETIQLDEKAMRRFKKINWAHSKRFIYGSLLLFTKDNCRSFIIATILERDVNLLSRGKIPVSIVNKVAGEIIYNDDSPYTMIESEVYFEPYFHVLKALQDPKFPEHVAMNKYIVRVDPLPNPPAYLTPETAFTVDTNDLMKTEFRVLNELTWPTREDLGLDETQYEAYKLALTHEFAVIQGPPGTGKTYLGVKVAKTILENLEDENSGTCLMLVICYTNHALDQFLEHILPVTKSIVRIGGQSRNEAMEKINLTTIRKTWQTELTNTKRFFYEQKNNLTFAVHALKQAQERFDSINNGIISFNSLKDHVPEVRALGEYYEQSRKDIKTDPLTHWLFENMHYEDFNIVMAEGILEEQNNQELNVDNVNQNKGRIELILDEFGDVRYDCNNVFLLDRKHISTSFSLNAIEETLKRKILLYNRTENTLKQRELQQEIIDLKSRANLFKEMIGNRARQTRRHINNRMNLGTVSMADRWALYFRWANVVIAKFKRRIQPLQESFDSANTAYEEARMMVDLELLKGTKVIGMTTSGAARLRKLLKALAPPIVETMGCWCSDAKEFVKEIGSRLKCKGNDPRSGDFLVQRLSIAIQRGNAASVMGTFAPGTLMGGLFNGRSPCVIVEEAAEVLEQHIVTALTNNCQHLVLIGDHQQLRPSAAHMKLARHFNMEISLFERMITNGIHSRTLGVQHRMRPEIAALISPHIYPDLRNHSSVQHFPNVRGMTDNLFFLTHNYKEEAADDSSSKSNQQEADMTLKLANYLVQQGYEPSDVTILTAYSEQMFYMRKERAKYAFLQKVKITVVDNYQGEEAKIILLSLVRNNDAGTIGFLGTENRVCVALSRAKEGFYIFGNINILKNKSDLWTKIAGTLEEKGSLGTVLMLKCETHPEHITMISSAEDFDKVPEGGCLLKCNSELPCGHGCTLICHGYDRGHANIKCFFPCKRVLCELEHVCPLICSDECQPCQHMVLKSLPCGHEKHVHCYIDPADPTVKCGTNVKAVLPKCGHEVDKPCHMKIEAVKCPVPCGYRVEKCGHGCRRSCHVDDDPDHEKYLCDKPCTKAKKGCSADLVGDRGNHQCTKKCHEPCEDCTVEVTKKRSTCKHSEKKVPCSKNLDEIQCRKNCARLLTCGHFCKKKCHEPCGDCKQKVTKTIPDCNHKIKVACMTPATRDLCKEKCERILSCGHACTNRCNQICDPENCTQLRNVKFASPCGHEVMLPCNIHNSMAADRNPEVLLKYCTQACGKELACGHFCAGSCGSCHQGRIHIACQDKCNRTQICGHLCNEPCNQVCPPCNKICDRRCPHSKCNKACGAPCMPCQEPCTRNCRHGGACTRLCGEPCSRPPCDEACPLPLPCGHRCRGLCGEPCPDSCNDCRPDEFPRDFLGDEYEDDTKFVRLQDCRHVLDVKNMDNLMMGDREAISIHSCPTCRAPIINTQRYKDLINNIFKTEINPIKERVFGNEDIIKSKREKIFMKAVEFNEKYEDVLKGNKDCNLALCKLFNLLKTQKKVSLPKLETQFQYLEILDMIGEYDRKYRADNSKTLETDYLKLIKLICTALQANIHKISQQLQQDIGNELRRMNSIIQLEKIFNHSSCLSSTAQPEVKQALESASQFILSSSRFEQNRAMILLKQLEEAVKVSGIVTKQERDLIVKAIGSKAGSWYKCPNGHFYSIDQCGGAMEVSKCVDCGAAIGGQHHRLLSNNAHAGEIDGSKFAAWSN